MLVGPSVGDTFEFPLPLNISVQQSSLMSMSIAKKEVVCVCVRVCVCVYACALVYACFPKVYLSKVHFCEMYPTCVSSKLCEFFCLAQAKESDLFLIHSYNYNTA